MTKKTGPVPEQPQGGGSYERQKDGSLKRVEFTEDAAPAPADAEPAAAPGQEG